MNWLCLIINFDVVLMGIDHIIGWEGLLGKWRGISKTVNGPCISLIYVHIQSLIVADLCIWKLGIFITISSSLHIYRSNLGLPFGLAITEQMKYFQFSKSTFGNRNWKKKKMKPKNTEKFHFCIYQPYQIPIIEVVDVYIIIIYTLVFKPYTFPKNKQ